MLLDLLAVDSLLMEVDAMESVQFSENIKIVRKHNESK